MNNANGGEIRKIKSFSDGLSADYDVYIAGFYFLIERIERISFVIIGIKTGDFGGFEELF